MLGNVRQLINVVKATFPEYRFNEDAIGGCPTALGTDVAALECSWKHAYQLSLRARHDSNAYTEAEFSLLSVARAAQKIMSNTASNYNTNRLYVGAGIAGIAIVLSSRVLFRMVRRTEGTGLFFSFLALMYAVMMFSSSYVEEEQQFWYWMLSGWCFYLYARCVMVRIFALSNFSSLTLPRNVCSGTDLLYGPALFAILSRILKRWNQTGQKFAAEPDIVTGFLRENTNILWLLIFSTYFYTCRRLVGRKTMGNGFPFVQIFYSAVTGFALLFKLSFTSADSPELLENIPILWALAQDVQGISLVTQARVVFIGLFLVLVYSLYLKAGYSESSSRNYVSGMSILSSPLVSCPLLPLF